MKKLALTLAVVVAASLGALAQGSVKLYNISSTWYVSTNGTGTGPGQNGTTTGLTDKTAGDYYYALLWASAPTSANPATGGWNVAALGGNTITGTNYSLVAGGITGPGAANGVSVDNWVPGASETVEVVGWSASLGNWAALEAQIASGIWTATGYYGVSAEGTVASGGVGTPASAASAIFNTSGGIAHGWDLNGVSPVPEPGTIAMAALGGLSLLAFRRKK